MLQAKPIIISIAALLFTGLFFQAQHKRLTLWVWDYAQDLTFLDPAQAEVAYYAGTIYVLDGRVFYQARKAEKNLELGFWC